MTENEHYDALAEADLMLEVAQAEVESGKTERDIQAMLADNRHPQSRILTDEEICDAAFHTAMQGFLQGSE